MLNLAHTIDMSATGYTPWVDVRNCSNLSVQTDCGAVNTPVGVVSVEWSNDAPRIEYERFAGIASASSTAKAVLFMASAPGGTNWQTGYDGSGAKASWSSTSNLVPAAFLRVKWTRTSGGAGDTLNVRWAGKGLL